MQFKLFCKHFLSVLRQFTPIYLMVVGLQIFVESIGSLRFPTFIGYRRSAVKPPFFPAV